MPTEPDDPALVRMLEEIRQGYVRGDLGPARRHLTDDAVVLGLGDETVRIGKDAVLDYLRLSAQKGWIRDVSTRPVHVRRLGDDVAVVVETFRMRYDVKGEGYLAEGRASSVLHRRDDGWRVVHIHMETLVSNPVAD